MAAVIGLLAVSLITTSLVASSVVAATEYTTLTRAGVQSQAAAEAGIADARAGLMAGTCASKANNYSSAVGAVPRYVATVWVPSGTGWVRGCPPGTATQVRILSTGYAQAPGVAGASARDVANIEVVLSSASVPTSIAASGPAIYAYSSQGFGGGGKLLSVGGSSPDVMVKEGNVLCTGGASGQADIVVNNGDLTVDSGCSISGNVWASGKVSLPGGPNVGGNVVANALSVTGGSKVLGSAWVTTSVTFSGGVEVGGNITAATFTASDGTVGGDVQTSGAAVFTGGGPTIKGNLTAASLTTSNGGTVVKNAWIYGSTSMNWGATIQGKLNTKSFSKPGGTNADFVKGTLTVTPGGLTDSPYDNNPAAPAKPFVPNWVDFDLDLTDWTGFASTTITGTTCSASQLRTAIAGFAGQPGVIDATGCTSGIFIGGSDKIDLPVDVVIFASKFDLSYSQGGGGFTSTANRRLWLITPDNTAGAAPSCTSGDDSFQLGGGFTFSSTLSVLLYTPCKVTFSSGVAFRGQIFSGKATIDGSAQLTYVAVGLPGVNLDTGATSTNASTEADRTIVSYRNVQVGN